MENLLSHTGLFYKIEGHPFFSLILIFLLQDITETILSFQIELSINPFCYLSVAYRGGEVWGVQTPSPEIPKALQNRAKLNQILKTVKYS
jgi:hypothetical protein